MPRSLRFIPVVLLTLLSFEAAMARQAEPDPPPADTTAVPAPPSTEDLKTQVEAEIREAQRLIDALPADDTTENRARLERELATLRRIELLLDQQRSTRTRIEELKEEKARLADQQGRLPADVRGEEPPYSILVLDAWRDELEAERARGPAVEAAVTAASAAVVDARRVLQEKENARRIAKEAEETNSDEARGPELTAARRQAEFESRIAAQTLAVRLLELEREAIGKDIHLARLEAIAGWIEAARPAAVFTRRDLESKLVELESARGQARTQVEFAQARAADLEVAWLQTRRRLDAATADDPPLVEEVTARRLALQSMRETIDALNKRLERLTDAETVWNRRHQVFHDAASPEELETWEEETRDRINALNIEEQLLSARVSEVRGQIGAAAARMETAEPLLLGWLRSQQDHLRTISETLDERLRVIAAARRLQNRLLNEIGVETADVTLKERLASIWRRVGEVWDFSVWSVDDRPITVGKIVVGVLLLFFGLFASRTVSRLLGRRIFPRLKVNEGAAAAIQAITFYVLLITFALFAFRAVNIPLTAFTVLGGALAIGVGFGSQAVVANFISGLILLAERPVRVGDLVDIDTLSGTVEHIGARSTRVRTGDNVEIVVPNSTILGQNLVNWTLSEDRVRTHVAVGVVYGSPTREVTRLMLHAADDHGRVHKKPGPFVLFTEFGDNALMFEVHFWITMKKMMDRRVIQSDLRYRIDSLFREAGIVIAFPQRDVHLDSVSPIDVRVLRADGGNEAAAGDVASL